MTNRKDRNEALGAIVDRICELLPEGYDITIKLERGSGIAVLSDNWGIELDFPTNNEYFHETLSDALEYAICLEDTRSKDEQ